MSNTMLQAELRHRENTRIDIWRRFNMICLLLPEYSRETVVSFVQNILPVESEGWGGCILFMSSPVYHIQQMWEVLKVEHK